MKPSNIQPPPNHTLQVSEVERGLFVVENAYEGKYDFFEKLSARLTDEQPQTPRETREQITR